MGVRIISNTGESSERGAVLFDSVSGWAFGPVFTDHGEAEDFLEWVDANDGADPRSVGDEELGRLYGEWRDQYDAAAAT